MYSLPVFGIRVPTYFAIVVDICFNEPLQLMLEVKMKNKQYILQEILSEDQLEQFLKLRYTCFFHSSSRLFITKNENEIDINYYDRNSNHYGLYLQQGNSLEPVGYFRIILEEPTKADAWIRSISERLGMSEFVEQKSKATFPCFDIYPGIELARDFYGQKKPNAKAGEISRLAIIKSERSVRLSMQLLKSASVVVLSYLQYAFVACFLEHSKAYTRLGFNQYPGSSTFSLDTNLTQNKAVVLYWASENQPEELNAELEKIQNQYLEKYLDLPPVKWTPHFSYS
jgi:hypothetical protein